MNEWEKAFNDGLKPMERLSVSEWSNKYRRLSVKSSSESGRFRTSRTPYIEEPMNCLSAHDDTERVVMMFASQTGKTESMNCALGYFIDHAPAPALIVNSTIEMSKRLSKQRLDPMIEETPVLKAKIAPPRSRDSSNTMMAKDFPNGFFILTGSNSATGLRSTPCKYVLMDEVDSFVTDVDGEGDPVELAIKRATTFPRRKILLTSTPTIKDFSRIEAEYLKSDQRIYKVPCPLCGEYQPLEWKQLKFDNDNLKETKYECISCKGLFDERHKTKMLRQGKWEPQVEGDGITKGYRLNGLYSPLGWLSWEQLSREFLAAKKDAPLLKTFVNTRLSETWSDDFESALTAEGLLKRCEGYDEGSCPDGVLLITQGVDCQKDRLEVSTWGWGANEESWLIEHFVIDGDPHQPQVWKELDFFINREYEHANGKTIKPVMTAIDSGGLHTSEVYQYARERQAQGVIAIKGQSQRNKPPIGKPTKVDINIKGNSLKKGALVYPVGSDTIKNTLVGRLKSNKEDSIAYIHFHATTGEEYFKQITSERQQLKTNRAGFQVAMWVKKPNQRNEALDCWVYSYAAMVLYISKFPRNKVWGLLENKLNELDNVVKQKKGTIKRRPSNDFVNNW
tara:strand:- start:44 stop:1906 length:1863 start_codon:yes stop_codon:yes gene_type:complete